MPDYHVAIKKVEPQVIASIRAVLPKYSDIGGLYAEIFGYLGSRGIMKPAGPTLFICHDTEYKEKDVDVEVGVPIAEAVPDSGRVKVYELPGMEEAACVIYKGPYEGISPEYGKLFAYVSQEGLEIIGPMIDVYLNDPNSVPPEEILTEIMIPVK